MLPTNLHLCSGVYGSLKHFRLSRMNRSRRQKCRPQCHQQANKRVSVLQSKRQSFMPTLVKMGSVRDVGNREEVEDDDDGEDDEDGIKYDFLMTFKADGTGENDTIYDTVTFGAPAAHVLGFKKGGLRAMIQRRKKLLDGEHLEDDEENNLSEVQWFYKDEEGAEQGPWNTASMREWYSERFLSDELPCRLATDPPDYWSTLGERFRDTPTAFPEGYGEDALEQARAHRAAAGLDSASKSKGKEELKREAESMTLKIEQRKDLIVCQALSALVLSFSTRLEVVGMRSPEFLQQLVHVGYLFQVESLVSTHGDEQGMLDDFIVAMDALQLAFACLNLEIIRTLKHGKNVKSLPRSEVVWLASRYK